MPADTPPPRCCVADSLSAMSNVRAKGWRSRGEAVRDLTMLALAFLLLAGVAAVFLDRAYLTWAAAHGHGMPGTFTATHRGYAGKRIAWSGDFTPDNGGPTRIDVVLANNINGLHVGRSIPAVMLSDNSEAFAATDTWGWLPLTIFGAIFASLAAGVAWFTAHHLRAHRRRPGPQEPAHIHRSPPT